MPMASAATRKFGSFSHLRSFQGADKYFVTMWASVVPMRGNFNLIVAGGFKVLLRI